MNDATVSHENVRASNVTGTTVYNTNGDNLGQVDDIVIGKQDGQGKIRDPVDRRLPRDRPGISSGPVGRTDLQ